MRCTYIGLAAALSAMGMGVRIEKYGAKEAVGLVGNHRVLADLGSHRKNSTSVSAAKLRGDYAQLELRNLQARQAGGACGAQAGRCPSGLCCSDYGFCGDSVDHCAPIFNCQPQYGVCGWPRVAATTAAPPTPTTTSAPPPPTTSSTTSTSTVVSTSIVSLPPPTTTRPTTTTTPTVISVPVSIVTPTTTSRPPSIVPPSSTATGPTVQPTAINGLRITTNGQCGNGTICIGASNYGPCCSQFFWCGSGLDFCGAGCKSDFGACLGIPGQPGIPAANETTTSASSRTSVAGPTVVISTSIVSLPPPTTSSTSTPLPPTTTSAPPLPPTTSSTTTSARPTTTAVQLPPGMRSTTDGKCGSGVTCLGSTFGRCCSQFGWCGDGDQFCPPIVGCQSEFGACDP